MIHVFRLAALAAVLVASAGPALAQRGNVRAGYPCADPWITSAYLDITGSMANEMVNRTPLGYGSMGECNPSLYGNGSWSSYADLQSKVRAHIQNRVWGQCRDAWVTRAVTEVKTELGMGNPNATPVGYGEMYECNMHLYSNGSWSSYADLRSKVRAVFSSWRSAGAGYDVNANLVRGSYSSGRLVPSGTVIARNRVIVLPESALQQAKANGIVSQNATGNIISGGAGNIISGGAGNIVAGGAGNIVSGGAGN